MVIDENVFLQISSHRIVFKHVTNQNWFPVYNQIIIFNSSIRIDILLTDCKRCPGQEPNPKRLA